MRINPWNTPKVVAIPDGAGVLALVNSSSPTIENGIQIYIVVDESNNTNLAAFSTYQLAFDYITKIGDQMLSIDIVLLKGN